MFVGVFVGVTLLDNAGVSVTLGVIEGVIEGVRVFVGV